jgi:hypothetical protein
VRCRCDTNRCCEKVYSGELKLESKSDDVQKSEGKACLVVLRDNNKHYYDNPQIGKHA